MNLFLAEHNKLWKRNGVKICVLLCFFYVVIVGNILTFQWFSFGSNDDATSSFGNHFDGYDMIKESQAYARTFGELTDETIQRMVRDYQRLKAEGKDREREWMDRGIIDNWLETLWPELKDSARYETMITYVDADQLTGFYERRQQAVEDFLKISGQTGGEQEYLLKMESKVQKPFRYQWVESWSQLLGSILADLGMVMALFLAIVLSPLFAGEWHSNTGGMILATRNGWRQAARTKIMVGFAFTLEFFTLLAGGMLTAQLFFLGFSGWDMPIQTIKLIAVAPINMLGAELYEYGFTLLGVIGYAGVVMLISAAVRNHILALLLSLFVVYGPMMISSYLPMGLQKALDLLPLVGSGTDIFRTNTFHLFGTYIWSPWLLLIVPVLLGLLCVPFAVRCWARKG